MRKQYSTPIVEKITFDFKVQTVKSNCAQLVANETNGVSDSNCNDVGSTPIYVGIDDPAKQA